MEMYIFLILATWFVMCFVVAGFAQSKGRNASEYFFLALIISPLLAFLVILAKGDSDDKRYQSTIDLELAKQSVRAEFRETESSSSSLNHDLLRYEMLEKLGNLLKDGIITKEEFEFEKQKLQGTNSDKNVTRIESFNTELTDQLRKLRKLINNAANDSFSGFDEEIVTTLRTLIIDRNHAFRLGNEYKKMFGRDLIEDIKNTSNQYSIIEKYLMPFSELGIVGDRWPHSILLEE